MNLASNWITSPQGCDEAVYTFRKDISLSGEIEQATLTVTAMGIYNAYINGNKVTSAVLTPGWTSYKHRVQYQTYDVTALLDTQSRIEIGLGLGWAAGCLSFGKQFYADHTSLTAKLDVLYTNGNTYTVVTDEQWQVYTSNVTFAELYHGETLDKTAEIRLIGNAVRDKVDTLPVPQVGEWITEQERISPVSLITTPSGERVIDFGQNLTGYVEINIKGCRGHRIVLHHAEVLDKDGNFYTENYRRARNEVTYVLSGENDVLKPSYSFQGFRYIRLTEYPYDIVKLHDFTAIAVHSALKRTGSFVCGNTKINQLYHNVIWGQKGNYLDIPTDCPQRDERMGWAGDAQVFCRTAAINFDVERFFQKWFGDMALEQQEDGGILPIIPYCLRKKEPISAAWGDVACIAPWQIYLAYGNKELLRENFPMMKKWVEYIRNSSTNEFLWLGGCHLGDWLGMDGTPDSFHGGTSNDLIASAFYAYSTSLLIKAGNELGEDVSEYRELHKNILSAFRNYFMHNGMPREILPSTEISPDEYHVADRHRKGITQTSLSLILRFDLCEEKDRKRISAKLAELVRSNGMKMNTGFVGTPHLLHALSESGYTDIAYNLLFQENFPSWLYSVNRGATTMWEHWDSIKEDGTFWDKKMNSFNHYAYGAVFDWIFGVACGISPTDDGAGYKKIRIAPHPDKRLGFADAHIDTRQGRVRVHWYYKNETVYYEIEVPNGTQAYLTLPSGSTRTLSSGIYCFAE